MFVKLIFILSVITLQGCSWNTYDHGDEISTKIVAHLPSYSVNDVFIFTNKYIERVAGIKGDVIDWDVAGGAYSYKAYNNFTLPKISWETITKIGSNKMDIPNKTVLWPLTPDEDYRLQLTKSIDKKNVRWSNRFWFQEWVCETNDPRRITVPAGTFNTVPITCDLRSTGGTTIRTKTWYYAPAIGHYVKRVVKTPQRINRVGKIKEYELTGYIPAFTGIPKTEIRSAEEHLQASLEKLQSGSNSTWESADKKTTRLISILGTFETKGKKFCRNVAFKVNSPAQSKSYTTIFCRDEDAWRVAFING